MNSFREPLRTGCATSTAPGCPVKQGARPRTDYRSKKNLRVRVLDFIQVGVARAAGTGAFLTVDPVPMYVEPNNGWHSYRMQADFIAHVYDEQVTHELAPNFTQRVPIHESLRKSETIENSLSGGVSVVST